MPRASPAGRESRRHWQQACGAPCEVPLLSHPPPWHQTQLLPSPALGTPLDKATPKAITSSRLTQPVCCSFQAEIPPNQEACTKPRSALSSGPRGPALLHLPSLGAGWIPTKQAGILIHQAVRGTHPRFPFVTPGLLQTTQKPPQSRSSDEALRALPIPLISDAPSCRSACLGLRGLQRQAFFRVLDR